MISETKLHKVRELTTLREMLYQCDELFGEKTGFLAKRKKGGEYFEISFSQFKKDVEALGARLIDLGLKDSKIAIMGNNCYQWVVAYMATVSGVGVAVPIDKDLKQEEIVNLIKAADCEAVFFTSNYGNYFENINISHKFVMDAYQNDESMTAEHHIYNLIFQGRGLLETGRDQFADVTTDPEQMVEILFTSGTTGTPKGVMLSNKNICHVIRGANQVINLKKDDRALSVLPIHHTLESSMGILAVLFQGGSVAFCEGLKYMLKNMRESEASLIVGVPLIIESMYSKIWKEAEKNGSENAMLKAVRLNRRLMTFKIDKRKKIFSGVRNRFGGNFRYLISGAAAIDPAVLRGFIDLGFDVSQGYGLTETAPLVTVIPDFENAYKKSGSVGLAIPGVEIKIDQPDEDGIGEILIKGANVMMGYYNMPEETAEVIKDGWLHSGDLGFMDPDGWLYITGRSRNIIVTKTGKNIYPEEIEAVIRNLDYVVDCMVYGVKEKNEEEYRITVQIFPDYEALEKAKGNMTDDEIFELFKEEIYQMNRKLASYKRVKDIIIRKTDFVRTTTRKIKRQENI